MTHLITATDHYDKRTKKRRTSTFRYATREEVARMQYGHHVKLLWLKDKVVGEAKVNGAVKTWKRDTDRLEVPIKYGLYSCATLKWDGTCVGNGSVCIVVQEGEWNER